MKKKRRRKNNGENKCSWKEEKIGKQNGKEKATDEKENEVSPPSHDQQSNMLRHFLLAEFHKEVESRCHSQSVELTYLMGNGH